MNNIIDCYDKTAKNYANKFINELSGKHLDRILLQSFATENIHKGKLIDLGCGPGQTTKFLFDHGVTNIVGTDLSPNMIAIAKEINPQIDFAVADMLNLPSPGQSFGSAIAFYSIVHFDYKQVTTALVEINRVLKNDGDLLFSFHTGDNILHLDDFLEHEVDIDFYFFDVNKITTLLDEAGFDIVDIITREPYRDAEHPTKRAYIWVRKNSESGWK